MLYEWRAASLGDGRDALLGGRVHKVDGCVRVLRQSNDVAKRQVFGEVVVNKVEVVAVPSENLSIVIVLRFVD